MKKREISIGALHYVRHVEQRGRLLRFIPCVAGQGDGCQQARNQVVSVAEAGIEYQKASFIKEALVFRFPKTHDENSKRNWKPPGQAVSRYLFDF